MYFLYFKLSIYYLYNNNFNITDSMKFFAKKPHDAKYFSEFIVFTVKLTINYSS